MIRSHALVALAGAVLVCLSWAAERDAHAQPKPSSGDLRVLPIRGNIYLIAGAGANVVASVGKDGVLLVDTGPAQMADKVLETVRALSRMVTASPTPMKSCVGVAQGCQWWSSSELLPTTAAPRAPRPIIGIINTSDDPDHLGGNGDGGEVEEPGEDGFAVADREEIVLRDENVVEHEVAHALGLVHRHMALRADAVGVLLDDGEGDIAVRAEGDDEERGDSDVVDESLGASEAVAITILLAGELCAFR